MSCLFSPSSGPLLITPFLLAFHCFVSLSLSFALSYPSSSHQLEREENHTLTELSKLLQLLDPNHRLTFVCSSVKDLGCAPDADWSDEE